MTAKNDRMLGLTIAIRGLCISRPRGVAVDICCSDEKRIFERSAGRCEILCVFEGDTGSIALV